MKFSVPSSESVDVKLVELSLPVHYGDEAFWMGVSTLTRRQVQSSNAMRRVIRG